MTLRCLLFSQEKIVSFLSTISLFSAIPQSILEELANELELVCLPGGEMLFRQNDLADSLYILVLGSLRVIEEDTEGNKNKLGDIASGSVVGEIGCLINHPRTATIYAIRDSALLKMTRKTFDEFLKKHPEIMIGVARECISRLVGAKENQIKNKLSCFTLIPAANNKEFLSFVAIFVEKLSLLGDTLLLTEEKFNNVIGEGAAQASWDHSENINILAKVQALEFQYKYIIYVADKANPWALRCFRQADKILLVGRLDDNPSLGEVERLLFDCKSILAQIDLVLVSSQTSKKPVGTTNWFKKRELFEHYHVRNSVGEDFDRALRLFTGNGLGLVLSGGGASALAHIGLLQALKELNIKIDYVGGTSMGAIIASAVAMGIEIEAIPDLAEDFFTQFRKTTDYTLPINSLLRGRNLNKLLKNIYEDRMIEDLWINFFSVSTSLNKNMPYIHNKNLLWKAIRASISLPGIFPVVYEEGHLLVDGGILNNLPVDIMQSHGCKVLASFIDRERSLQIQEEVAESSSGWVLFFKNILLPKIKHTKINDGESFPNIFNVIHSSVVLGGHRHQQLMVKQADYHVMFHDPKLGMLDFKSIRDIVNTGYREAIQQLEKSEIMLLQK